MSLTRGPLLVVHAAVGTLLVLTLLFQLRDRERQLVQFREETNREVSETRRLQREIAELESRRDGMARKDPYVVELMVREKLQYTRPGEIAPPPSVDKPRRDGIR
jgi:cell division protein FtsB